MLTDDVKNMVVDDITATIHTLESNPWYDCSVFSDDLIRIMTYLYPDEQTRDLASLDMVRLAQSKLNELHPEWSMNITEKLDRVFVTRDNLSRLLNQIEGLV